MREQASVFSGCCRLYAPRYRQMVLGGYLRVGASSRAATDLAYADVVRAFDHYLANDNKGRPFIIAGHSQGSRLARRLIEERIDGRPVARRMIAAYIPGHWIERAWFARLRSVRPCSAATDTGCVVTWSSWEEGRDAARSRRTLGRNTGDRAEATGRDYACTNPLTWSQSTAAAPASANLGGWVHGPRAGARTHPSRDSLAHAATTARCTSPRSPTRAFTAKMLPNGNFHNYDINLFYMNIRANVRRPDRRLALTPREQRVARRGHPAGKVGGAAVVGVDLRDDAAPRGVDRGGVVGRGPTPSTARASARSAEASGSVALRSRRRPPHTASATAGSRCASTHLPGFEQPGDQDRPRRRRSPAA